jgi:hypothetical protein
MVSIPRDLAQKLQVNTIPVFLELWDTFKWTPMVSMSSIRLIFWVWEVLTELSLESSASKRDILYGKLLFNYRFKLSCFHVRG